MKRIITITLMIFLAGQSIFAIDQQQFDEMDRLFYENRDQEGYDLVKDSLSQSVNDIEKSELLWRYSQFTHEMAGIMKKEGSEKNDVLEMFMEGHKLASEAIEYNPDSQWAYYWRAANIGSWGSTKGILDSLGKVEEMKMDLKSALEIDDSHGDSWSVLAILDADVPGILGGSLDRAVSYDRKACSVWNNGNEVPWEWFSELSNHLYKRDWDSRRRNSNLSRKQRRFNRESDLVKKNGFYEGSIDLSRKASYSNKSLDSLSDREESKLIIQWMIRQMEILPELTPYHEGKIERFRKKLQNSDWG